MARRTRRQFLEDSMLAAAAAAVATSSGKVLAEPPRGSRSAGERLGVAVVGVRGRGNSHISEFAGRRDTEILYICDVDRSVGEQRVSEAARRQRGRRPIFEADLRRVLEDPRVDIVSIATPNHWHALSAIWSMQAGKDVYLEKPVSHNVAEGRRLVDAARKYERICQTGTQARSNPGMMAAMDFARTGGVGRLLQAKAFCSKPRGSIGQRGHYDIPSAVDYHLWLGPAPQVPLTRPRFHYDWHWQWAYGNGELGNQGVHQMDLARWGLGLNRLSQAVISFGGRLGVEDAAETADTQTVVHDYGDKTLVCEIQALRKSSSRRAKVGVILEGTEGYLVMTSYSGGAAFDLSGSKLKEFAGSGNHFDNFLKAVRSRKLADLNADVEEGHYSSALCHLGNISYRLGRLVSASQLDAELGAIDAASSVRQAAERMLDHLASEGANLKNALIQLGPLLALDATSETFPASDAANQLLTRAYRKGFEVPSSAEKV